MLIAHQLWPELAEALQERVPPSVRLHQLTQDDPWNLPEGTDALLVGNGVLDKLRAFSSPPPWVAGLKWLHFRSTGIDMLPDWLLTPELVTVSRGAQAVSIAEYVLAAMLSVEKSMPEIWIRDRADWAGRRLGTLSGRTLGMVGYGSIGQETAGRALAFGMRVVACRRSQEPPEPPAVELQPLETVLGEADHLVLCAPLTEATRGMIGAPQLAAMRDGSHLINVARGELIDEAALRAALDAGRPALASLDVWRPEPAPEGHWIYTHPRVRLSPHVSFASALTEERIDEILFANLAAFLAGRTADMHGRVSRPNGY